MAVIRQEEEVPASVTCKNQEPKPKEHTSCLDLILEYFSPFCVSADGNWTHAGCKIIKHHNLGMWVSESPWLSFLENHYLSLFGFSAFC